MLWSEELPLWYEMSSNESYIILDKDIDIDSHKLALCRLILDKEGEPLEIEEPFYEDIEPWNTSPAKTLKLRWRMKHRIL